MSDRTQGSVRTDSREGDGAAEGVSEAATPGNDGGGPAGGVSAVGEPAATAAGTRGAPAPAAPERPVEQTQAARSESRSTPVRAVAAPPPSVDGTQVITPHSPPSGVFAGPAPAAPAVGVPARSAPPAGPSAPSPAAPVGRAPGSGAGASGAGRPAVARTQAPVSPESTQAVPLPPTGTRPAGAPGRPAVAGTAGAGVAATSQEPGGRVRGAGRGPRRARLQLRHIDTWSALKISLVVSIALFFVWMVAVGILYGVLSGLGVFSSLNDLIGQVGSVSGSGGSKGAVITAGVVFGGAAVIGAINVVLLTALCTVGAVVYNLCSDLVGGVEVTLAEHE